jgi:AraC-like DNA-binding protein
LGALLAGPWRGARKPRDLPPELESDWMDVPLLDEQTCQDCRIALELLAERIAGLEQQAPVLDRRVQEALAYIDRHFAEPCSVADTADGCGLSASRLTHLLREQTGRSFQQHLLRRRVAEARRLLMAGDQALADVALAAGFSDQSHMGLLFRRETGLTPRRFRLLGGA